MLVKTQDCTANVGRLGIILMPESQNCISDVFIVFRHTDNKLYRVNVWPMIGKNGAYAEASKYITLIDGCTHCNKELKALNIMVDRNLPPFTETSYSSVYEFMKSFKQNYSTELHAEYNIHAFYGGK